MKLPNIHYFRYAGLLALITFLIMIPLSPYNRMFYSIRPKSTPEDLYTTVYITHPISQQKLSITIVEPLDSSEINGTITIYRLDIERNCSQIHSPTQNFTGEYNSLTPIGIYTIELKFYNLTSVIEVKLILTEWSFEVQILLSCSLVTNIVLITFGVIKKYQNYKY